MLLLTGSTHGRIMLTTVGEQKANYPPMTNEDSVLAHDDGLIAPDVGAWAEEKHRLLSLYSTLFSSGMKAKWSRRIYVQLYAARLRGDFRGTVSRRQGPSL